MQPSITELVQVGVLLFQFRNAVEQRELVRFQICDQLCSMVACTDADIHLADASPVWRRGDVETSR